MVCDRNDRRVRIVTLKPQQVDAKIADFLTEPDVMEGWNAPRRSMDLNAFRAYVASYDCIRRHLLAIRTMADDRAVGLLILNVDHRHKTGAWHLCIGNGGDRGRRVVFPAAELLVRHAFEDHGLEKLGFEILARNATAIAIAEKYDLTLEAVLRSHRIDAVTGDRLDERVYGMTADEYRTARTAREQVGRLRPFEGPGLVRSVH